MSFVKDIVAGYLALTERSQFARFIVYGMTAFAVIFGIDLLWHMTGWSWYWEQLACDVVEAAILAFIASHLSRLREERIIRRQREVQYLNHHIRNALSLIQMAAQQLESEMHVTAVRHATNRICGVLEQMSRNEELSIDDEAPQRYKKAS
jgi:light-regulated signal transduction histidine kinase (bacteriophytochrome)